MMKHQSVSLEDRYRKRKGQVFLSGIQALVRLPMIQIERDRKAGLNTAGFISGYRGSPLGGYDLELQKAEHFLKERDVHFEPGLNEDLAATAIWGTQQVSLDEQTNRDGVFGIWYGKGPGVDRSMDVIRHGNAAGTSRYGGVLCIAGDDHGAKSSTLPHQTDHNFMTAMMPVLSPAGVHEYVEYGLLGIAMSRYSGCWVAMKAVSETVECSATVDLDREQREIVYPDTFEFPEDGVHIRWPDPARDQDYRLQRYKCFAAHAFAKANKIDRVVWDSPNAKFGIMTTGKSYQDVRQALYELGITKKKAAEIGLRLYKVGMPWPLEPSGARAFCEGLEEVLVIEEKREMIEHQLKWQLFNWREEVRPTVVGKLDEHENWLLPPENDLSVSLIAHVIAERLEKHYHRPEIRQKLDYFKAREKHIETYAPPITRSPYFCSGCPHNRSTKVPEGSKAMAGIGCHYMASLVDMDRPTEFYTQMGGEGVPWIGQCRYTDRRHLFANLGDGTYQHSGLLAIRAAVAAKVSITYKILYNDAVAMTGGQHVEGGLTVEQIVDQVKAEGVRDVFVVSETPERFPDGYAHPRDEMMRIQQQVREIDGVTIIVYDQTCAAEKRRRRKRGLLNDPDKRVMINADVCEGCGDCSVQSNCVSVEPLETEFGRKRQINQSTCNKDFSCVEGFCPSFVTVEGAKVRKAHVNRDKLAKSFGELPAPVLPEMEDHYNIIVTGIGGTGVLTIGSVLGMAAHLEGRQSLISDMTGLAQKGGAVYSTIRLGRDINTLRSSRIITGGADLLISCDPIVSASPVVMDVLSETRSSAVVNTHLAPTQAFVLQRNVDFRERQTLRTIEQNVIDDAFHSVAATELGEALAGDSIATNIFMLGYAFQKGLIPLSLECLEEAIKLNGVAVEVNLSVFAWGRRTAHSPEKVLELLHDVLHTPVKKCDSLEEIIAHRSEYLAGYQNEAYATDYRSVMSEVRQKTTVFGESGNQLAKTVARNLAKLMTYKDEYEVARLYTNPSFQTQLDEQFEGKAKLSFHLAPPLFSKIDENTGRPRKLVFGAWILGLFSVLAKMKGLRGTAFDLFGYSSERKSERDLIVLYRQDILYALESLTQDNLDQVHKLLALPGEVRGFGPVKMDAIRQYHNKRKACLNTMREKQQPQKAA